MTADQSQYEKRRESEMTETTSMSDDHTKEPFEQQQSREAENPENGVSSVETPEQQTVTSPDPVATGQEPPAGMGEVVEGEVVISDTENLRQLLEAAEAQVQEHKDKWLRAVADLKNMKRRTDIERSELTRNANISLLMKLLPIIDDFERALASVPPEIAEHPWWGGTKLIAQKFRTLLESEGVEPIEAVGQDFDPNWHEAVLYEDAKGQEGKVVAELQTGYRLNDRLLRPTMVKVGRG